MTRSLRNEGLHKALQGLTVDRPADMHRQPKTRLRRLYSVSESIVLKEVIFSFFEESIELKSFISSSAMPESLLLKLRGPFLRLAILADPRLRAVGIRDGNQPRDYSTYLLRGSAIDQWPCKMKRSFELSRISLGIYRR